MKIHVVMYANQDGEFDHLIKMTDAQAADIRKALKRLMQLGRINQYEVFYISDRAMSFKELQDELEHLK